MGTGLPLKSKAMSASITCVFTPTVRILFLGNFKASEAWALPSSAKNIAAQSHLIETSGKLRLFPWIPKSGGRVKHMDHTTYKV